MPVEFPLAAGILRVPLIPPPEFALPSPDAIVVALSFAWPDVEVPLLGWTFRTATHEWEHLNRTVGTFDGFANPGTGVLVIEAESSVPSRLGPAP
jgi:hypothetical protein